MVLPQSNYQQYQIIKLFIFLYQYIMAIVFLILFLFPTEQLLVFDGMVILKDQVNYQVVYIN